MGEATDLLRASANVGEVEENDVDWYLVRFRDLKPGSSLLE